MTVLWKGIQVTLALFLITGLLFASGVFAVLLYAKLTGQTWFRDPAVAYAEQEAAAAVKAAATAAAPPASKPVERPKSVLLEAPHIRQRPELPSGCEVTSLAMLLQFYGVNKSKMDLVPEMKKDPTPIRYNKNGSIAYWGNPNTGFVGEVTGAAKGFAIYHTALFELLKDYVPTAQDMTKEPFSKLEDQLIQGIPSVVWTTINYKVPDKWVVWDTPIGPIETTFMEHAVLLVGFDEQYVYVNDPLAGQSNKKIDKEAFIATWDAMGRQALSYTKAK
ncbi:C39 family peptidase [Paenibacillus sp. MZ04-78.2]|uniref:C39 family peptidase n=1 Tax=Paenibacillus sp. MZ04-78.2 TaxID=2962034 RepID=UPI0020B8BF2C|nr:C39 family peptidase [Paenibacillus sp. MZ04-78.2]MCP3771822.1 C39 family peptidase [Paenibacillus sp. MZ04-78.2]